MKYPDKTACVVMSGGLFIEIAVRLARDFGTVLYCTDWRATFPRMNVGLVGFGVPGIKRVDDVFGEHFDSVDLWVFPDLYQSELQVQLEKMGKRVWGSRHGEEMEIYREICKEKMEELGLPVQPWRKIKGIAALRRHLKNTPKQHVKVDKWRGDFETFFAESHDHVAPKLDEIASDLGAFQEVAEFIVEDDLPDCVEVGLDAYCIDGKYPGGTLVGIEVKDLGYVSEFREWSDIPKEITQWTTAMGPEFARYGYRGFLSNELRIGKDKVPYMIDACCRAGCPPNELYQEFYKNFSEIIWEGANGNMVDPEPAGKFGVEVIIRSDWAKDHWQPIDIDPAFRHLVKVFNPTCVDGKMYAVPQGEDMAEVGAIVGWGETIEAAHAMVKEAAEGVSGYGLKIPMGEIDKAIEQMEEINALGLDVFTLAKQPKEP